MRAADDAQELDPLELRDGEDLGGTREDESLESAAASQRQSVDVVAANGPALRGQVVDALTGQGLPCVELSAYAMGEKVRGGELCDLEGHFELAPQGERAFVQARDRLTGKRLARRRLQSLVAEAGVWRLDVGPSLVVRLRGAPDDVEEWRMRLVERPSASEEHAWSWCDAQRLEREGVLAARYRAYEREAGSGAKAWIQVEDPSATWKGEKEIDRTLGVHAVEIHVEPFAATLGGRVVDEQGHPVHAKVTALRRGVRRAPDAPWPQIETDGAGQWSLSGLDPGPTRLLVVADHRPTHCTDVELERGARKSLEIVLDSVALGGPIQGAMVAPIGGMAPVGLVRLESVDGGSTDLARFCLDLEIFPDTEEQDARAEFDFGEVPPGRYRVSVVALDGRNYTPISAEVEPPAKLQFETVQATSPLQELDYSLSLRDARTGGLLSAPLALYHLDPFWSNEVESGDPVAELGYLGAANPISLVVAHVGYRPAALFMPDALRSAQRTGNKVQVELALEPGFGAALIVLDAGHSLGGSDMEFGAILALPGLRGARVVAGGRAIGTSDERGLALCKSDGPIEDFDVQLAGWTMLAVDRFRGHSETPDGLGFVLMIRD